MAGTRADQKTEPGEWQSVAEIPRFPYASFSALKTAISDRKASIGVDALAAARWADISLGPARKAAITALSLLLIAAAVAAVVAGVWTKNYWLLGAVAVQAGAFYFSHPASAAREWATLGGVASIIVFIDFLLRGWGTAAVLVAYAGLTFAAGRAAGFITASAFRKALASDEELFLAAYRMRACTLRDNKTKRVYQHGSNHWSDG
ncbi:MAG TPA: hypothetical protein VNO14_08215 [Blastocatellia bacterium]|nr:hypothetical protein [Blastocatellia bacterium]